MGKELPAPELLRKMLRYEPDTGKLFWRKRSEKMFSYAKGWNVRFAGKEAFTALSVKGYLRGDVLGVSCRAHRVIWAIVHNEDPLHNQIDHVNGRRTDNRIENLRLVDHTGNCKNAKQRRDNTSGRTGVTWNRQKNKWQAYVNVFGKKKHLGLFPYKRDAIAARVRAEIEHGFHQNHGRTA